MHDTKTEQSLTNLIKISLENEIVYRNLIDNATMYCVRPSGTKFWLYKEWVLAEWSDCKHSNPFETWRCPNEKQARQMFDSATHNELLED